VAAIVGKNPYRAPSDSIREEFESSRNKDVYRCITQLAEFQIPNVKAIERKAAIVAIQSESVGRFASQSSCDSDLDKACSEEIVEKGSKEFNSSLEAEAASGSSPYRLDVEKVEKKFKSDVASAHVRHRGTVQEADAVKDMREQGSRIAHVTDSSDVGRVVLHICAPPSFYYPSDSSASSRQNDGVSYSIVGRVDAWEDIADGKKAIVEIKTRKSRLMEPEYDMIQLACYMVINHCNNSILAQRLNGKVHKSEVYHFDRFAKLWEEVKTGLDAVASRISLALTNKCQAIEFLRSIYPLVENDPFAAVMQTESQPSQESKPEILVRLVHQEAQLPKRGTEEAIGYDLFACESLNIKSMDRALVDTGVQIAILPISSGPLAGCRSYGRIAPRSGLALRNGVQIGAGVIDPDYRGNIKVLLFNFGKEELVITTGDRIAQIIFELVSPAPLRLVAYLPESLRMAGGFGSTGK
jgi:dUTP pyrophosphatase